jgi:hypothetical protein
MPRFLMPAEGHNTEDEPGGQTPAKNKDRQGRSMTPAGLLPILVKRSFAPINPMDESAL